MPGAPLEDPTHPRALPPESVSVSVSVSTQRWRRAYWSMKTNKQPTPVGPGRNPADPAPCVSPELSAEPGTGSTCGPLSIDSTSAVACGYALPPLTLSLVAKMVLLASAAEGVQTEAA